MKKYGDNKLAYLADADLIWPKKSSHYTKLEEEVLKAHDIPYKKDSKDYADYPCDTLVHEELWWDMCSMVNDLAQMVLDEREKRRKFLDDLKSELKDTLSNLSDKNFKEYY